MGKTKIRIAFWFIVIMVSSCATLVVSDPDIRKVQVIVDLPKMKKNEIFSKTMEWMAKTYVSSKEVIQLSDQENGKIIGRGMTQFNNTIISSIPCEYSISIDIKDEKIRITCDNYIGLWGEYQNTRQEVIYEDLIIQINNNLELLINKLIIFLKENKSSSW